MADFINIDALAEAICKKLEDRGRIVPRLLSLDQASTYLGMTKAALKYKALDGQIPCVRADKKYRFDRQDLDAWIEDHKAQGKRGTNVKPQSDDL